MGFTPKYATGETVFLKKMGVSVTVISLIRGAPNRYVVSLSGTTIVVSEKQLNRTPRDLKLGRARRNSKFKPGDIVQVENDTMGLVLSLHKYRKGFRYTVATPSKRKRVLDEDKISKRLKIRMRPGFRV